MSDDPGTLERWSAAPSTMPTMVGTPEALRDTLDAYAEAGVDEFIVPDFTLGEGRCAGTGPGHFPQAGRWPLRPAICSTEGQRRD